jgi:hypothetical protein
MTANKICVVCLVVMINDLRSQNCKTVQSTKCFAFKLMKINSRESVETVTFLIHY